MSRVDELGRARREYTKDAGVKTRRQKIGTKKDRADPVF